MVEAKYMISGRLTTMLAGTSFAGLKVVAYKPLGINIIQIFGSCDVDARGSFEMELSITTAGRDLACVYLMPIPEAIERFGVLHIEMSIPGLFFPRFVIAPKDWRLIDGVYKKKVEIDIPSPIWRRWAWLSEEFTVIGRVLKRVDDSYLPVPHAWVSAADVDLPLPYGGGVGMMETDDGGNFTINFRRVDFFINYAMYDPSSKRYGTEAWPDLIFHVTQKIAGIKTMIYEETEVDSRPKSSWDVAHRILYVNLITDIGITNDECYPPIPAGDNFLFHGIGLVQPHSIIEGYATTGPRDDLRNLKDCPFGSTLHIKGQFDTSGTSPPKYYQVLYARWTGATPPSLAEFQPILNESWTVSKFDSATGDWRPISVEPISGVVVDEKVYEIADYADITLTEKTRLISWRSDRRDTGIGRYPDGRYDLLIKAWDAGGNPVAINPGHPERNRLTVMIDNKWPKALLEKLGPFDILRTDEMSPYTPVCPVFSKSDPAMGGHLAVTFNATDENKHVFRYWLSFITGHNFYVDELRKVYDGKDGAMERFKVTEYHRVVGTPSPLPNYRPDELKPPGGFSDETNNWNIGSPDVVRCAYQVRLRVWDRTINGYGYIHHAEDTMHFSIEP